MVTSFDMAGALLSLSEAWSIWTNFLHRPFLSWPALLGALGFFWVASLASSRVLNGRLRSSLLDDLPLLLNRVLVASFVVAMAVSLLWLDPYAASLVVLISILGVSSCL